MRNVFEYYNENDYLAHHGIIGQKWGIRRFQNPDGTLTAAGKERYGKKVQDIIEKDYFGSGSKKGMADKIFNTIGADKKYLRKAEDLIVENYNYQKELTDQVNMIFKDLRSKNNIHFYEAASELAEHADYRGNGNVDEITIGDFGYIGFHGVLDDGQQGKINAYSMYTLDHNLSKKIDSLQKESIDVDKNSLNTAKEYINKAFKDLGLEDLSPVSKEKYPNSIATMDSTIISSIRDADYDDWESTNGSWYLDEASYANHFTDNDRKNISKASNYVRKIDKSNKQNTWWYVSEAAENLGMDSIKLKNMTQTDWDRLNAEIRDLRASNA